ncbi:MAG: hypothetical protein KBD48_03680 [Candidatus Pacebacteria bacterium]|nr:hypothetical protein [Candidatus Paceibacterota bacterium]
MNYLLKKKLAILLIWGIFVSVFVNATIAYATLSCSVTTAAACTDTVLLRISGSSNAHAELPSQATATYDGNVVCCNGVTGLGNSCSGNYAPFIKLSGVSGTNSHVEETGQSNYSINACLSSSYAGDVITTGYQATNCTGYDTTLFSMANTTTNSHVGSPAAYNNKVCAKVVPQSITFNISDSDVGFGNLSSSGLRYATGDGVGSATDTVSYTIDVSTNAASGYGLYVRGDPLKNGASTIDAIGGANTTPSAGTKAFGIRADASGGVGAVVTPYDGSGFAYDADANTETTVASATSGNGVTTTYSIHTVATIDTLLDPGNYSTNLIYIVTANF